MKLKFTTSVVVSVLAMMATFIMINTKSYSQSQGALSPVWVLNHNNLYCNNCPGAKWNTLQNIEVNDDTYSTSTLLANGTCSNFNCFYSQSLTPTDYGFSIPQNASITGIVVQIYKQASAAN